MQLQLRPAGDGRTMYLTDARGRVLPGQIAVAWEHGGPGRLASATVSFAIDGEKIEVVTDPVDNGDGTLPEALEAFSRLSEANKLRFIEAARPHPLDRAFAKFSTSLDRLRDGIRS